MYLRNIPLWLAMIGGLTNLTAEAATTGTLNFAGDENRTITLPPIKISDLDTTSSAGQLDFEIAADCESDIRNVIFLFAGSPSAGNGELFANTGGSGGTALWLAHRAPALSIIPANGTPDQRSRTVATTGSKAVLPLAAAYHKTGAAITQGTLASAVTVSITYN